MNWLRNLALSLCLLVALPASAASPVNVGDHWWTEGESGWGLSITQQEDVAFVALYFYGATGSRRGTRRRPCGMAPTHPATPDSPARCTGRPVRTTAARSTRRRCRSRRSATWRSRPPAPRRPASSYARQRRQRDEGGDALHVPHEGLDRALPRRAARELPRLRGGFHTRLHLRRRPHRRRARRQQLPHVVRRQESGLHVHGHLRAERPYGRADGHLRAPTARAAPSRSAASRPTRTRSPRPSTRRTRRAARCRTTWRALHARLSGYASPTARTRRAP